MSYNYVISQFITCIQNENISELIVVHRQLCSTLIYYYHYKYIIPIVTHIIGTYLHVSLCKLIEIKCWLRPYIE